MTWIIEDVTIFDELKLKDHGIPYGTFYNARTGKPISTATYRKICDLIGRNVQAKEIVWGKGFSVDLFFTDHDMKKKSYKQFKDRDPSVAVRLAGEYLSDPDNARDIFRDDLLTNQDEDETITE